MAGIQQGLASLPAIIAPIGIGWLHDKTDSYLLGFLIIAAILSISVPLTLTVSRPASAGPASLGYRIIRAGANAPRR